MVIKRFPNSCSLLLVAAALALVSGCSSAAVQGPPIQVESTSAAGASAQADDDSPSSPTESYRSVFEAAERSVVYIETPSLSTGSGIVLDGGWIVTNEHVVRRFPEVMVGTADGTELGNVAVVASDPILDLAVLGPIDDAGLEAISIGSSSDLRRGDRIFLLGFPDEGSRNPTPAMTSGIVGNFRSIAVGDFPFIQTDAAIGPGQSGGAMLNSDGELVGISGLAFGDTEFSLVYGSDSMIDRVLALIDGEFGIGEDYGEPERSFTEQISQRRFFAALVEPDDDGVIDIAVSSDDDVFIELQTLDDGRIYDDERGMDLFTTNGPGAGEDPYFVDRRDAGDERMKVTVPDGQYIVLIGSYESTPHDVTIRSGGIMRRIIESETSSVLSPNQITEGVYDWVFDSDRWSLELTEGDEVTITADGIADTFFSVTLDGDLVVADDDSGLGMFGTGSRATFTAEQSGTYQVEIGTFDAERTGYLVEVEVN